MAAQDVKNYADENWNQYLESITELSKEQKNGNALVTSDKQMYNFDKITKKIYAKRSNGVPTEYSRAAEPPVQCGVSHLSRRTEPHCL